MHIVGYYQQCRPRRQIELYFSRTGYVVGAVEICLFVFVVISALPVMRGTIEVKNGVFGPSAQVRKIVNTCNSKTTVRRGFFLYTTNVDSGSMSYILERYVNSTVNSFLIAGIFVLFMVINKLLVDLGVHEWQLLSYTIFKSPFFAVEILLLVLGVCNVYMMDQEQSALRTWAAHCNYKSISRLSTFLLYGLYGVEVLSILLCLFVFVQYGIQPCIIDSRPVVLDEYGDEIPIEDPLAGRDGAPVEFDGNLQPILDTNPARPYTIQGTSPVPSTRQFFSNQSNRTINETPQKAADDKLTKSLIEENTLLRSMIMPMAQPATQVYEEPSVSGSPTALTPTRPPQI